MTLGYGRIISGVVATPNINTNLYYTKPTAEEIKIEGSFYGLEYSYDWMIVNEYNSSLVKAGVIKVNSMRDNIKIKFKSSFNNSNYSVFFLGNLNTNIKWQNKSKDSFEIESATDSLGTEISWIVVHTDVMTAIDDIFVGTLSINDEYAFSDSSNETLKTFLDSNEEYSVLLSADSYINKYYTKTPVESNKLTLHSTVSFNNQIDYLIVKKGLENWLYVS